MAKGKSSKSVPKKCSDAYLMRCIGPSPKDVYRCSVFRMDNNRVCGGAVINTKKGTIRFYA